MKKKRFFTEVFLILGVALFFHFLGIRVCPFFFVFRIPCPGCGLTRATISFLQGEILISLRYNFLAIPIIIFCGIYSILLFFEKEKKLEVVIAKYKNIIILFVTFLVILVEIVNVNNPLLY